jgi:phytoene dehydrogenase-like protein
MARIVVIGGGLTGMAAAARLAKGGHQVELLEARDRLGGAWAPTQHDGQLVDAAPSVIGFPAPWRDLFRKSGRPLEAELERGGHDLISGPPARYLFADGTELTLPAARGEQFVALSGAYGTPVAERWRDLLDSFDDTWQALRPLGLEAELRDRRRIKAAAAILQPRRTLAHLAAAAPHPNLGAIIRSVAHRLGSTPEHTPGWCAVELAVARTFGRWTIDSGRTSVLVDTLEQRLKLRRVSVLLNARVEQIEVANHRIAGVTTSDGRRFLAGAVVCTADPWQTLDQLLPATVMRGTRRNIHRLLPALAPHISHTRAGADSTGVSESIHLTPDGVPTIIYVRPGVRTTHDFTDPRPDPSWGPRWRRGSDWARRPAVTSEVAGLFLAGASSPGGSGPSQVVLSAALAAAACDDYAQMSISTGKEPTS